MKHRLWQVYATGLLLLVLLLVLVIPFYLKRIPAALEADVRQSLQAQGLNWALVEVNERDVILGGNAPTPQAYQQAVQTAQQVIGVRNVVERMKNRVVSPYTMTIDWRDGKLSAQGFLPDAESQQALGQLLTKTYGNQAAVETLKLADGNPAGWTDLMKVLFTSIKQLEQANAEVSDKQLYLAGKIPTSEARDALIQTLSAFKQQGYSLDLHLIADDSAARVCQQKFDQLLKTPVSFQSGNAIINAESRSLLESLAETAMLCPYSHLTIAGHTDKQGDNQSNLKLSEQRAQAVAGWLFQQGIETSRIKTVGYGASRPLADNATEQGRAKNRRIEVIVQGK
jgi:OmpA-OmpF porin, OOP family